LNKERKYTADDLKIMQSWSLERKIQVTQTRIIEWYQHWDGKVYVSFSGGKDSTVLLDLARRIYPDIPAVYVDTGLEYPEIKQFVRTKDYVTWLRPEMRFDEVIKKYGWVYPSKDVALYVYYARGNTPKKQNYINRLRGLDDNGEPSQFRKRYEKYAYLLDAPFKISHRCCLIMKEKPLRKYERTNKVYPIVGTMADESQRRKEAWLKTGCNAFDGDVKTSQPMSFWTEQDVLRYIKLFNVPYASIYGEFIDDNGTLRATGEQRTGCMFCPIGCHLDNPNKYQRMKITHPNQYKYCMKSVEEGGLGLAQVLDYIGVPYE
jgi:3'-phosphoadenosine 5'-phosphosulfate sulfotransferase (PAPS reductase)/FAD synthetase